MFTEQKLIVSLVLSVFAASAGQDKAVYVVTGSQQFGTVDLATGAFHQIGPGTPEPDSSLVPGPHGMLFSLATLSGSLVSINPATGATTVIGPTGLGSSAFDLAEAGGKLYMTDFSNNLYSVNAASGAATLIGPTGIPPDPAVPFTFNPDDGTFNLCDETLYGVGDKLYATFDSFKLDPATLAVTQTTAPDLWQIDPATGLATLVAPTTLMLGASADMDGTFYAFHLVPTAFSSFGPVAFSQLVTLDLTNGNITFVRNIDSAAGPIFGAAPVHGRLRSQ
jgi:hypothetical protein